MTTGMQALPNQRFIRKTELGPNEYRKRFRQVDDDIIAAITSPEADRVTPLMSKIYLRLANAPDDYWEREGVLRFEAEVREGKHVKAWDVLCDLLSVSSATANKALMWMHREGIIGYFSGKNGVGLRIFLNRAASSIGIRPTSGGKKILDFSHASSGEARASQNEAAFKEAFGNLENSDPDLENPAPKNGAGRQTTRQIAPAQPASKERPGPTDLPAKPDHKTQSVSQAALISAESIVREVVSRLDPLIRAQCAKASAYEFDKTRSWFSDRALPKAVRVALSEAFDLLKQQGYGRDSKNDGRTQLGLGRAKSSKMTPRPLSPGEIDEHARMCVTMLKLHGQTIDLTLSELSAEAGGHLLAQDAPKVRRLAESLLTNEEQDGGTT